MLWCSPSPWFQLAQPSSALVGYPKRLQTCDRLPTCHSRGQAPEPQARGCAAEVVGRTGTDRDAAATGSRSGRIFCLWPSQPCGDGFFRLILLTDIRYHNESVATFFPVQRTTWTTHGPALLARLAVISERWWDSGATLGGPPALQPYTTDGVETEEQRDPVKIR